MTPEEIQAMAKGLAQGQAVWYVLSAMIGGGMTGLLAYFAEKGKNRATREDIAAITHEVENVKDVFNRQMEDLKAHHQLRMVAAERRMQAHQEAYAYCVKIQNYSIFYSTLTAEQLTREFMEWYASNGVFLTTKSRKAVCDFRDLVFDRWMVERSGNTEMMDERKRKIRELGEVILNDVNLPSLKPDELSFTSNKTAATPPG